MTAVRSPCWETIEAKCCGIVWVRSGGCGLLVSFYLFRGKNWHTHVCRTNSITLSQKPSFHNSRSQSSILPIQSRFLQPSGNPQSSNRSAPYNPAPTGEPRNQDCHIFSLSLCNISQSVRGSSSRKWCIRTLFSAGVPSKILSYTRVVQLFLYRKEALG
jgi:hypothetical protein